MKRHVFAVLGALLLTGAPLLASQGGPKPKPPKPQASVAKPLKPTTTAKVKPVSVKHTASKPKAIKPVKTTAVKPAKSTVKATGPSKATKTTKSAKADTKKSTTTPTTTSPDQTAPATGDPVTLTKVQQKLQRNTKLADKLSDRLPLGTNLMAAAEGFKNLGQFVAAVNVSNNHGYAFTELKTLMVDDGYSLGQAMQKLKAESNTTVVAQRAQRAETDAQAMIAATEREIAAPTAVSATNTSTTTATTTTKSKAKPKKSKKAVGGQQ